jgi:hypothetical protein
MKATQYQPPKRFLMRGLPLITALMFLGCAQSVSAQWSPIANPTPTPGTNIYYNSGNVGIGTASPTAKFQVAGTISADASVTNPALSGTKSGINVGFDNNTEYGWIQVVREDISHIRGLQLQPLGGNVGIGKPNPEVALDVVGDIQASGVIHAKYQDVAEWVPSSEQLSAGTVVVLDSTKSNHVMSSTESYDPRVAGVISAQPGIALGEKGDGKVLVATTGRVKIKVDATMTSIRIGDLLVSSDVPGMAMKSEPIEMAGRKMHMPGTLIGKALEPLEKGMGEILVLLSLQ